MFYIIKNEKIQIFDDNKEKLETTLEFMPQYRGLEIQEVPTGYEIYDFELITVEEAEARKAQKERERLDMLFLTGADVERGIYQAKGMDFDDILAFVTENPPEELDIKALKIELKANNFYRGNPYVNAVGALLGFTSEQLDKFFETKDYHELLDISAEEQTSEAVDTPTGDDVKETEKNSTLENEEDIPTQAI